MKNILMIDIDTDRKDRPVIIAKPQEVQKPTNEAAMKSLILDDMACLCEALCTLIHLAEQVGARSSPDSLRSCIKHLQDGFADASYEAFNVK